MRRLKKVLLILLVLLLLSQIPFAYRRYKLGRLNAAIESVNASRKVAESDTRFKEFRGVIHVHSFLGGHSEGSFAEIISAAQSNQLHFVVMTEHTEKEFDTAAMTLQGEHGGVLFVNGNEVTLPNDDKFLVLPGNPAGRFVDVSVDKPFAQRERNGQVVIAAYPEKFKGWDSAGYDGIEVYNVYSNARQINPLIAFCDVLWSHRSYPDLLFASFYERSSQNLEQWDHAIEKARLTAVAGNDAHANIGISLRDSSGNTLLGLKLDPYATSFHLVRVHVLIPSSEILSQRNLLDAIKSGHCFIAFDIFGDTTGFNFTAENASGRKIQGDEINLQNETKLRVHVPVSSRIVLFKNGNAISDNLEVTDKDYVVTEKGVYRVEVYLPQLGKPVGDQPWIISNPIYVR